MKHFTLQRIWTKTDKQYYFSLQQVFTCSNSTIEALKKVRNMLKVNNNDASTTSMASF